MVFFTLISNCVSTLAYVNEQETLDFKGWTTNIMTFSEGYDVLDVDGNSCKMDFIEDNKTLFLNEEFDKILDYFQSRNLRYSFTGIEENVQRGASVTTTPYQYFYHNGQNDVCNYSAVVKMSITIRGDDSTGIIRSYSGPNVSLISLTSNIVSGQMKNITTRAEYSDTRRTITAYGSYDIVLYPANVPGLDDQVFGRFNVSFVAG